MTDPPAAKRFKLRGPKPQGDHRRESIGDTIVVARPQRTSTHRKGHLGDDGAPNKKSDGLDRTSSDLSSAPPSPAPESLTAVAKPGTSRREDYGDFMSYYIAGDPDEHPNDKGKAAATQARRKPNRRSPVIVHQEAATLETLPPESRLSNSKGKATKHNSHALPINLDRSAVTHSNPEVPTESVPPQHTDLTPQQQQQQSIHRKPINVPIPYVPLPKTDLPEIQITDRAVSAREKTEMLNELSSALTAFTGVLTPPVEFDEELTPTHNPLDPFLAAIEGDDEESSEDDKEVMQDVPVLPGLTGEYDNNLSFGILFICHALHSWASQRIYRNYTMILHQHQIMVADAEANRPRGRGRPKKDFMLDLPPIPSPPDLDERGQYKLSGTPEGRVVNAFYAVLQAGALQVNAFVGTAISRALVNVYKQIDRLINQGERLERPFRYLSYWAQIQTNAEMAAEARANEAQARDIAMRVQRENDEHIKRAMGIDPLTHPHRQNIWPQAYASGHPLPVGRASHTDKDSSLAILHGAVAQATTPTDSLQERESRRASAKKLSVRRQSSVGRGSHLALTKFEDSSLNTAKDPIIISSSPRIKSVKVSDAREGTQTGNKAVEPPVDGNLPNAKGQRFSKSAVSQSLPLDSNKILPPLQSNRDYRFVEENVHTFNSGQAVTSKKRANGKSLSRHLSSGASAAAFPVGPSASMEKTRAEPLQKKLKLKLKRKPDVIELSSGS